MDNTTIALLALGTVSLLGPLELLRDRRKRRGRTARTRGQVVGHELHGESSLGHDHSYGPLSTSEVARVRYTVGGREYTCVSRTGVSASQAPVGSLVEVHYDPSRPADGDLALSAATEAKNERVLLVLLPAVGLALLAAGIVRLA